MAVFYTHMRLTMPAKPTTKFHCSATLCGEALEHVAEAQSEEVARRIAMTIWGYDPDKMTAMLRLVHVRAI